MKAGCDRPRDEIFQRLESPDPAINLAIIYEDPLTREWAEQVCDLVAEFIDEDCLARDSWTIGSLAAPKILPAAVRAAAQADVIVLSLHAAEELPLNLQVWIEAWLPRRDLPVGTLITLISLAEESEASSLRTRRDLEAIARQARMDLLLEERRSQRLSSEVADDERNCGPTRIMFSDPDDSPRHELGAYNPGKIRSG